MPPSRIYQNASLAEQQSVALDPQASHHLLNVLRMRAGDTIVMFNGDEREYSAVLEVNGKTITAIITDALNPRRESPAHISLVQGISRGDHMDWAVQKAVELGVSGIKPVYCTRSIKPLNAERAEKKRRHWQGIIISACEQSGRCKLPELETACPLAEHLATRNTTVTGLVLDPDAGRPLKEALPHDAAAMEILIGPEGGLSTQEVEAAAKSGYIPVSLGPRILRTETAGIAALAIVQSQLGDMR